MAVTLKVTGNGHFRGAETNVADYSVTEDSSPTVVSDTSGSTGGFSVTLGETWDSPLLINDTMELIDESNGRTTGKVDGVSGNNDTIDVTTNSRLNLLMANVTTAPFTGTLQNAFIYYLSKVGITTEYSVDISFASTNVVFSGFEGNMWEFMKQLCAVYRAEISLVSGVVVVRPIRKFIAETGKMNDQQWGVENSDVALNVEVYSYRSTSVTNSIVYPQNSAWTEDMPVFQVDAKETLVVEIPLDGTADDGYGVSLSAVEQPVAVTTIPRTGYNGVSAYTVSGNDGLPVDPQQWTDGGGKITVKISPDTHTLILTIKGTSITKYAPYRIGVSSGAGNYYSTLRLRGTGVIFDKKLITIPTGARSTTSVDVGVTIDSPFINSDGVAFDAGVAAAQSWAGVKRTLSGSASVINRRGEKGTANLPKFSNFNTVNAGVATFGDYNTAQAGKTFAQFNAEWNATVADDFENQAFGNVAGARVKGPYHWYRVRSANTSPDGISFQAESDTTFNDLNAVWTGKTFDDFNVKWTGKTFEDLALVPLWL